MVAALPLVLFPFCLIAAALNDIRTFRIPNMLSVILIAGFAVAAVIAGMDLATLGNHVLTSVIVLIVGFGLNCLRIFGAGDAKILTAIALWFGWPSFLPCLIYIAFFGGVLSVGILIGRMLARAFPAASLRIPALGVLAATEKLKAPYGVAICVGTLVAFNESPLFQTLVAQLG